MVAPRLARRAFRRENGFFSLFVGFALALQIKLSGGKPSSAPVLHHRECRFQICKNRDSWVHAHSLRPQLGCNRCIVRRSVAQSRIRSWAPVEALHVPPSRPTREAGCKSSHATVSPITPAGRDRNHARAARDALGAGLGGVLFGLLVALAADRGAGGGLSGTAVHDPARLRARRILQPSHGKRLVGRVIGVLTLTPYDFWRRKHAAHHASSGNLDRRGLGDVKTLTVREYLARSLWGRLCY